jgi:hypothetical protein
VLIVAVVVLGITVMMLTYTTMRDWTYRRTGYALAYAGTWRKRGNYERKGTGRKLQDAQEGGSR